MKAFSDPMFWQMWGIGHVGLAYWFLQTYLNPADQRFSGGRRVWLPPALFALGSGLLAHFMLCLMWHEAGQLNLGLTLASGFTGQSIIGAALHARLSKAEGGDH